MKSLHLSSLRRTAAQIAAAAVFETFPQVQILGGADTSSGFVYDFYFPHLIHPELHFQIEEKMRQIIREKREIRDLEMVPFSAKEFLKSQGHFMRADSIRGDEGLVGIVKLGSFCDLGAGKHCENSSHLGAFKLFPPISLGEREMRLTGAAYPSKQELRQFLKEWAAYPKTRHEKVGEEMGLWRQTEEGFVWLASGLRRREALVSMFKENLCQGALEISAPETEDRCALLKTLGVEKIGEVVLKNGPDFAEEGLFEAGKRTEIQIVTSLEKLISSLQSIEKTLNILTFDYSLCLMGSKRQEKGMRILGHALENLQWKHEIVIEEGERAQINFLVADRLGRMWSAVAVEVKDLLSVRVPIERNLALLLEQQEPLKA